MNSMGEALLKAGLITADAKKLAEYETEAKRIFAIHEKNGTTFTEDDIDQLSKEVAREAIKKKAPLNSLNGLIVDAIRREKIALKQAKEMSKALESPSRVTGVMRGPEGKPLIYSVNPKSIAKGMKTH